MLYDERGRLLSATDALGSVVGDRGHSAFTVYDAAGQVVAVTDPLGRTTRMQYDDLGRQIHQTFHVPGGPVPSAAIQG
ncbi:MAG: hypothetical protein HQ567_02505, partial [Candidatus Nealsonbacteria bacterium]|nr:hypothetical protein [Candidatus Nealsonbacteria bacterium]